MTNITMLSRTIEQLRDASMLAKPALADQALAQALGLFQAYDAQLSEQRVTLDNLNDRVGAQAVEISDLRRELSYLRTEALANG